MCKRRKEAFVECEGKRWNGDECNSYYLVHTSSPSYDMLAHVAIFGPSVFRAEDSNTHRHLTEFVGLNTYSDSGKLRVGVP